MNYILLNLFLIKFVSCGNIWQNYEFDSGVGNREEIFIERIVAQENITVNGNILKWKGGANCPEYAIGIGLNELTILKIENRDNRTLEMNINYMEFEDVIEDALIFSYYNYTRKSNQIIQIIIEKKEIGSEIKWYKFDENIKLKPELFWSWNIHDSVVHVTYSEIENKLITILKNNDGEARIDVIEFSIEGKHNFSIVQSLPLESATDNTALNFDGTTTFLSLPQGDHVRILKYHRQSFISYKNITCTFVEQVTGFQVGIQSYLAIDGWNAGIYKFHRRTLVKQKIEHGHLEGTNYWLPIPVYTYHHEDILLVQKNVSHDTFDSLMLEVVSKDGNTFSFQEETVCDYLGDHFVGLNCITDEHHSLGLKNAAVLSNGDSKALVLSHSDGTTTIFKINIGLKDIPSAINRQIDELRLRRKHIEEAMQEFKITNRVSSQLKARLDSAEPDFDIVKQNPSLNWNLKPQKLKGHMNIEDLKNAIAAAERRIHENAVLLENRHLGRFDTIIINGLLEVHGNSRIRHVETNNDLEKEIDDLVRIDNIGKLSGHKKFVNLQTQNLTFETVNDIDAAQIKHKGDVLNVVGDVIFEKPVTVKGNINSQNGLVNGADLALNVVLNIRDNIDDTIHFNDLRVLDTLTTKTVNKFEIHNNYLSPVVNTETEENDLNEMVFDKLYLPGNLTVKYVNTHEFDEFLQSLCFRNLKTFIPGTVNITGKSTLTDKSTTKTLNSLNFPDDYVVADSEDFTRFTGKKHFKLVQANEATTTYLNDFEPDHLVTLSQDQEINGKLIFDNLEIAQSVSVHGKVAGSKQNIFIPNPTMMDSNHILANVNFKCLEVEGDIIISNNFDGLNFEDKMKSIVYKDYNKISMVNPKQFVNGITVETNLEITSNIINKIRIEDLVSKVTNDELNLLYLNGNVEIRQLQIKGLINNCNITKLEKETVKLSGDQFLTSQFIFAEEILISNTLDIRESINDLTEFDLLFNDGNIVINGTDLQDVFAQKIVIEKDIYTEIKDFNLEEFEADRLSYTKDQYLTGTIEAIDVETSLMNASVLNDHSHFDLFTSDSIKNKIRDMFFSEKLTIQNLVVEESLNLSAINDVDLNELISTCIWNAGINVFNNPLVFLDNIHCNNLFIDKFNGVLFEDFYKNIVYKNETDVTFNGLKNFTNGFHVKNYIETKFINNIRIDNILRKRGDQIIRSSIEVLGDVIIENAEVADTLNGVPINQLIESYERVSDNTIKINGDVMFSRFAKLDKLQVNGFVNGQNITKQLDELMNLNEDMHFTGNTIFEDFVYIKGNMDVLENVNGVDMEVFNENVVCISNDAEFDDVVTFGDEVDVLQKLYVETDFLSRFINGIDMQTWLENAVFINKGIILGSVTFDHVVMNGNLITKFVNDLNMSTLIPLRTDQNLDVKFSIGNMDVFSQVDVGNLVNDVRLETEIAKSVLTDQENIISSEIIFVNNVVVREELNIASLVNEKDLGKIITTNTDQIINGKFMFTEAVVLERGLDSGGFVNDINLTDWEGRGLKKSVNYVQTLVQPIFADKVVFDGNVIGTALVNKMDARTLADQVEGKKLMKNEIEEKLLDSYPDICTDVNLALKLAKQQLYSFDYLEKAQVIDFGNNIELLQKFEFQGTHYLLVHEQNTCVTNIFSWSKNMFYYAGQVETGVVNQVITIKNKDIFFVARSDFTEMQCNIEGSNIWKFEPEDTTLKVIFNIEDQALLQESQIPNTFYGILRDSSIIEYQLSDNETISLNKYRKWQIKTDNLLFIPRGLNTGIALTDGINIYRLMQDEPIIENDIPSEFEIAVLGTVLVENNTIFPGRMDGEAILIKTGEFNKNLMVAVTHYNKGILHRNIKIYDDWKMLTLYQEIQAVNPSSLMTIYFENNGESFIYFLEDNRKLRIFQYKGVLGFIERVSVDIDGSQLIPLELTIENDEVNHFIVVVEKNRMKLYKIVMRGSNTSSKVTNCDL